MSFFLTLDSIETRIATQNLQNLQAGAMAVFEGWVRDHNQGKTVSALEYQVYPELAQKEGEKILAEAKRKYNLLGLSCIHRHGLLQLGDCAVWVGATAAHRDDAFKATRYVIDELKHRLPIWKKEHYVGEQPEWVYCRDHHTHVHFHEKDYYQKQTKIVDQQALKYAKVVVIGAGGLGCPVLQSLACAGVGHIFIVDFDRIEISNLHRQPLYASSLVGEKKAVVAAKRLTDLNPYINVDAVDQRVDASNVETLIRNCDLVIDCTDNYRTKLLLNDACFRVRIPFISASIFKHEGFLRTYVPGSESGCMRCHRLEAPDDSMIGNCNDFGVLGASVAVLGAMQASEALAYLQRQDNATIRETLFVNMLGLSFTKIRNSSEAGCGACRGFTSPIHEETYEIAAGELNDDFEIVDMREKSDDFLDQYRCSSKKIVVVCHRGIRSLKLAKIYRAQGCAHFYSLAGGACSL